MGSFYKDIRCDKKKNAFKIQKHSFYGVKT